jgi:UDP-glucose 4-epimerase
MNNSNKLVSLEDKKILITGGLGFIGSNLAKKCVESGAKVTIYDNLDPNSGGNLFNIDSFRKYIDIVIGDLINFDYLIQHVLEKDIIFNCAASTSHPFSMREPWLNLDVNSRGVINVLESIKRINRNIKLVHIGTSTQLGKLLYSPADENHPEFPTDIYSANKTASEKYVLLYAQAFNIKATVIRLPNVFGPRAAIHSSEFAFNNYFIGLSLQNKDIQIFGDGKQKRNILYIDDAVEALIQAAANEKGNGETFFAVSNDHICVADIAEEIVRVIGKGQVKYIPWPKDRISIEIGDAIISNKKFCKQFKWSPKYNLTKGLIETKKYFLKYLDRYI